MKLKVFTWNMARGRSMVDHPSGSPLATQNADARFTVLMELCLSSDIGFIQEAGQDLHGPIRTATEGPLPLGRNAWRASMMPDFQNGANPCRSTLFCTAGAMRSVHLECLSGGNGAERYAAAAIATINGVRVLLASFHATSGPNGAENTFDFLNFIDDYAARNRTGIDAILVGGDFNCEMMNGVAYPLGATHQNGRCYDGFYRGRPSGSALGRATVRGVRIFHVANNRVLRTRPLPEDQIGYFARANPGDPLAKVSDHAPVLAEFEIR